MDTPAPPDPAATAPDAATAAEPAPGPSFDAALAEWGPHARRYARRLLRGWPRLAADVDADQLAALCTWRAWQQCRNWDTFRPFLFAYVRGAVRSEIRVACRRRARGEVSLDAMEPWEADGVLGYDPPPTEPVEPGARSRFDELLAVLPRHHALVVSMHYRDGLTMREIACRLGMCKQNVHYRVGRALDRLRGHIARAAEGAVR